MFVADNSALIGNGDGYFSAVIENDALATQAAFKPGIDGAINKVFFLVGNFFQILLALFHINVTGGAGAYAATVVVEVNVVFFGNFQNRNIYIIPPHGNWSYAGIFKIKMNDCHGFCKRSAKVALAKGKNSMV